MAYEHPTLYSITPSAHPERLPTIHRGCTYTTEYTIQYHTYFMYGDSFRSPEGWIDMYGYLYRHWYWWMIAEVSDRFELRLYDQCNLQTVLTQNIILPDLSDSSLPWEEATEVAIAIFYSVFNIKIKAVDTALLSKGAYNYKIFSIFEEQDFYGTALPKHTTLLSQGSVNVK